MTATAITTLIVDDEPLARRRLRTLVSRDTRLRLIGESEDGLDALARIRDKKPQLVLLDVQMPELNGFEIVDGLAGDARPMIVFVTAYDQFAIRAFEVGAADYLLKPFDPERFTLAVDRAAIALESAVALAEWHRASHRAATAYRQSTFLTRVVAPHDNGFVVIETSDIDWIASADNYVRLYVGRSVHQLRTTMSAFIEKLDPAMFVRVHRWYAVNIARIHTVEPASHGDYTLRLRTGATVRVSRTFAPRLREILRNDVQS